MEEKKIKIEIRNRFTGKIIFEYEKVNNTVKETVVEAVKNGADLRGAYLRGADLRGAYLRGADLRGAYLCGADLRGAYLRGADLRGAYLRGAKNIPFIPMACPSDGAFVGWKKVKDGDFFYLVKLQIMEDSKRSSATGTKCRCDYAVVLGVYDIGDDYKSVDSCTNYSYNQKTVYKVGEKVEADSWDEDRFRECSNGIHFFINRQETEEYEI